MLNLLHLSGHLLILRAIFYGQNSLFEMKVLQMVTVFKALLDTIKMLYKFPIFCELLLVYEILKSELI